MNYRSRELLDLAYRIECTVRVPGECEGGIGEPAHANEAIWGKGGALKAHDFAFASSCRSCHMALDQGSHLSAELRRYYWLRGHVETMRQLWAHGFIQVNAAVAQSVEREPSKFDVAGSRPARRSKNRKTTASAKTFPRPAGRIA